MFNLKLYYDENRMFLIKAILKYRQVVYIRRKVLFTIFEYMYLFSLLRYSSFQNMQVSQVMTSLFCSWKYDEKRYLSQFVSEMFDSLQ